MNSKQRNTIQQNFYCLPNNKKHGVALLMAVLISSVALTAGLTIFSLLFNQLEISSTARNAISIFYAADTVAECALYWDDKGVFDKTSDQSQIRCGGSLIAQPVGGLCGEQECINMFNLDLTDDAQNRCGNAIVKKTTEEIYEDGEPISISITDILSLGENKACNEDPNIRTLQQGFRLIF